MFLFSSLLNGNITNCKGYKCMYVTIYILRNLIYKIEKY